jgi:hypothetical protein
LNYKTQPLELKLEIAGQAELIVLIFAKLPDQVKLKTDKSGSLMIPA